MSAPILRIVVIAFSVIPIVTGALGIAVGPAALPEPAEASATLDSEFRFTQAFWLMAGLLLLWSSFRMVERAAVTRLVLATAVLGGLARAWSAAMIGWPHPVYIGTLVLELVIVPLVLWWHARVVRTGRTARSQVPSTE